MSISLTRLSLNELMATRAAMPRIMEDMNMISLPLSFRLSRIAVLIKKGILLMMSD